MNNRLTKWIQWLQMICDDVSILATNRFIFNKVQLMIQSNTALHKPSYFYNYLTDTYVTYSVIVIRRHLKPNKFREDGNINANWRKINNRSNDISLTRLLSEIHDTPELLSKEYFTTLYKTSPMIKYVEGDYINIYGGGTYINQEMVRDHLLELKKVTTNIEYFADKRLAHFDKGELNQLPRYEEIDICIKVLDRLCCKYLSIFHAEACDTLEATIQHNWAGIFKVPWLA
ncbi:MAG: hypothetical protein WB930_15395 [Syntrophobacteraceae bacterium]